MTCKDGTALRWNDLEFWTSPEWQRLQEKFDVLDTKRTAYNPKREDFFAALDATSLDKARVCILGQDPYPGRDYATGIAFSIPASEKKFPPTLVNIFKELVDDLHVRFPTSGDLSPWAVQGVLLWNAVPTCLTDQPGSHRGLLEWNKLTKEIVEVLNEKGCIFVLLGGLARDYSQFIDSSRNVVLSYSHPSPLGAMKTASPFIGSRIFSTINDHLCKQGKEKIDWSL